MDEEIERIKKEKMRKMLEKMKEEKMETEIEATDGDFQEKIIERSKKVPVVVDFWAQWCTPCLMLGPIMEKLAKEYSGRFILAKVSVDNARSSAQAYGVMGIPSVKMFKDGKVVDEFTGVQPEAAIREWLDRNLGGKE